MAEKDLKRILPPGYWEQAKPEYLPDGTSVLKYLPPPHHTINMRRVDDLRYEPDIRWCWGDIDWYDPNLHPWIISQYSAAHTGNIDFRTRRDVRNCKDIRHPEWNNIIKIILGMGLRLRPYHDIALWYKTTLDIDTATGAGLDQLGRIIGVDRELQIDFDDSQAFGFIGSGRKGFNQFNFSVHPKRGTYYQKLLDYQYRRILWFKSLFNRSNDSAKDLNILFRIGLGFRVRKRVAVTDLNAMHMRVMMMYDASPLDVAIVKKMAEIAKPAGVTCDIYKVPNQEDTFGFNGSNYRPFGQGTFNPFKVKNITKMPVLKDDKTYFGFFGSKMEAFNYGKLQLEKAGTFNSVPRQGGAHANYRRA